MCHLGRRQEFAWLLCLVLLDYILTQAALASMADAYCVYVGGKTLWCACITFILLAAAVVWYAYWNVNELAR